MGKDLLQRFLINGFSALIIAILIFFASFWLMREVYALAVILVACVAFSEYCGLLKKKELEPATVLGIFWVALFVAVIFLKTRGPYPVLNPLVEALPEIVLALALFSFFVYYGYFFKRPLFHIATLFLGLVYIAYPLALFLKIMYFFEPEHEKGLFFEGFWWTVFLIGCTKSADMGGYFIGKKFGKRKLALKLSPKKTLEGFFSGLAGSTLVGLLICYLGKEYGHTFQKFAYWQAGLLGLMLGIAGTLGDLAESLLKRDAEVKDSSTLPGVGGILDMIDSLLFAAPVLYIFMVVTQS